MSKKDYKKGISDAMEAYSDFSEKQEAATRHVAEQVDKVAGKVDKLGDKIGGITGYITEQEKAELYRLNTPVDIADLGNQEKKMLLAILYQLATDESETTEEQQNYIRAVQKYLSIFNPQTEIDIEVVENIEDIAAQKAILQAVLEFFYLGTHPKSYTEDQLDFLECFQLNRKTRKEIMSHIETIAEAVGRDGIAEKYGFVAKDDAIQKLSYTDNGPVSSEVADWCIKQYRPIEASNYYCAVSDKDAEITFELRHKRTGESCLLKAEGKWNFRSSCVHENTVFIFAVGTNDRKVRRIFVIDADLKSVRAISVDLPADVSNFDAIAFGSMANMSADATCILFSDCFVQCLIDWKHGDRRFNFFVPFHIESATVCDGRILIIGEHQDTKEIWLYWHDPVKNQTYKAISSPLYASGSDSLLGHYDEHATAKIITAHRIGNHLALVLGHYSGGDDRNILCKYSLGGNTGALEIVCEGDIDENIKFYPTLLTEAETETGTRICALQNIVKHEISDDANRDAEYFDCATMEKIDIKEAEDMRLYGDYLFRRDGKARYKTNIHSNQRWEML